MSISDNISTMLQCLRRLLEEKDSMHAFNGLKYFSVLVAVAMRTLYEQKRGTTLLILAAVCSGVATIIATFWDLFVDWGLLRKNSKNPWLRDKLLISNKSVYFVAIVREWNKSFTSMNYCLSFFFALFLLVLIR